MTITPFLSLKIRTKKDAILARSRARRVAGLLSFAPQEQTCVAAGTFIIASQALSVFGHARLCFQIENHQLQIFAEPREDPELTAGSTSHRLAGVFPDVNAKTLYRLAKPLPEQAHATEELDLGWIVRKLEETSTCGVFEEITKQNQEILALLHELQLFQGQSAAPPEKKTWPHAA